MKRPEEAIQTLKKLIFIIPPFLIPGLKILKEGARPQLAQSMYSESMVEMYPEIISEKSEEESIPEDRLLETPSDHKWSIYPRSSIYQNDIEQFSVSTDVQCLFKIGKISAKHGVCLSDGLKCLNDFLLILDYKQPEMDKKTYFKMKCHARYYMGSCLF